MTVELAICPSQFRKVNTSVVNTNGKGKYVPLNTLNPLYYVARKETTNITTTDTKRKA